MVFEVQYAVNPPGKDFLFVYLLIFVLWAEHNQGLKLFHF